MLGIAGILNQTADKILFPYIYEKGDAHAQLGIYGAASKIAMIMAMITQLSAMLTSHSYSARRRIRTTDRHTLRR